MKIKHLKRICENHNDDDEIRFERKSGTFLPYMEYDPHEQWFDDDNNILVMTFTELGEEKWLKRMEKENE